MAKWVSSKIDIYFCDKYGTGEESSLPLLPEEFTCNIKGKNEEIDVLSVGGENNDYTAGTINLLKRPSLKTWTIDCEFSHPDKPTYENNDGEEGWTPAQWVNFFEDAMYNKKILEMTVTGINLVKEVSVEDFKHTKSAGQELDTLYTIELKEYVRSKIEHEDVKIEIVIPQPAKEVVAEKETIGNKCWLNGYGWKTWQQIDIKDGKYLDLTSPYKTIVLENKSGLGALKYADIKEYYFNFIWLPVEILELIPEKESNNSFSGLGEYITSVDATTGYETSNLSILVELFTDPLGNIFESVLKSFLEQIPGKKNKDMPGITKDDKYYNAEIYTQKKKLKTFMQQRLKEEYPDIKLPLGINKISESEKINLAKKFLKETATSSYFNSKEAKTQIVNIFGTKYGFMKDFIYANANTKNVTKYKLKALKEFYCIDSFIDSDTKKLWGGLIDVNNTEKNLKTTSFVKGTIICTSSEYIKNGTIQTENPLNNPFSYSKGELIKNYQEKTSWNDNINISNK